MKAELLNSKNKHPLLKQFGELNISDFEYCPVWVGCHVNDYNKPWYNETDEETFRPWEGELPIQPKQGVFLVRADFTLADNTILKGFITPKDYCAKNEIIKLIQPQILHPSGKQISFWFGLLEPSDDYIKELYSIFGKCATEVFPIKFRTTNRSSEGITAGTISGFYYLDCKSEIKIKR